MKINLFLLEKIVLLVLLLEGLFVLEYPHKHYFWLMVLLLSILSYIYEGARPYSPAFLLVALFDYLDMSVLQIGCIGALILMTFYFRFYEIQIVDKGQFNVGYKYHKQNGLEMSIFYPTTQDGKHSKWIPHQTYPQQLYDIQYIDPTLFRAPFQFFYFIISFLFKVKMPVIGNARLNKKENLKYKVMIFSHGLGSNSNNYSSLLGYWASRGYIIVCLQHNNDVIRIQFTKELLKTPQVLSKILYSSRNKDIIQRRQQLQRVFSELFDKNLLTQIFQTQQPINIEQVLLCGHSFGAATILQSMSQLISRQNAHLSKIKGLICLDTWFYPLSQSTYQHLHNQNIILINTQTFFSKAPSFYALQQKMGCIKNNNGQTLKAFVIKSTDHLCVSDFVFVFGTIFKYLKIVNKQQLGMEVIRLHIQMINLFLQGKMQNQILQMSNEFAKKQKLMENNIYAVKQWRFERINRQQ